MRDRVSGQDALAGHGCHGALRFLPVLASGLDTSGQVRKTERAGNSAARAVAGRVHGLFAASVLVVELVECRDRILFPLAFRGSRRGPSADHLPSPSWLGDFHYTPHQNINQNPAHGAGF